MFKLKLITSIARLSRNLRLAAIVCSVSLLGTVNVAKSAELNVRLGEDFTTLDPAFWQSGADLTMINVLFPKLIEFKSGSDWEYELQAAESIEQVDELTIKFKLKPGLMWTGDYGEVTTEDVNTRMSVISTRNWHHRSLVIGCRSRKLKLSTNTTASFT